MKKTALYFGCLRSPGHFLWNRDRRSTLDPRDLAPDFPWHIGLLDGGLLKNGKVPDSPDGRVFWTLGRGRPEPAMWHAFFWWDRSVDQRGACNSGLYVRGFGQDERRAAFDYACSVWPDVVDRQVHPLTLTPTRPPKE